ncbi:reverse transcriptase domain-containing protein, partial [Tanacetum coccineum]
TVAYKLELPQQLSRVHNTFYVSNLKKCLSDESLVISLEELRVDDKFYFVEELVEVIDREIKQLKRSRIPIIKVKDDNSSDQQQNGRVNYVKSSTLIGSLKPLGLKEAQEMMIFTLNTLTQQKQGHIKGLPAWQSMHLSNTPGTSYSAVAHFGGVTLIVYLAAAKETVNAVLMMEREAKQMPIYFISRALRGPKVNYTSMEKLMLALVHASKRLKRPRVSIKGQILADFIVERPEEESPDTLMGEEEELPEPWILFTDGSSCTDGSGAGLILTNPEGMEFTYALRFRFDATNNEA